MAEEYTGRIRVVRKGIYFKKATLKLKFQRFMDKWFFRFIRGGSNFGLMNDVDYQDVRVDIHKDNGEFVRYFFKQ